MMDSILTISIALVTSVFGPAAITYMKYSLEKRKAKKVDPLQEALNMNNVVEEQLELLLEELKCDHIWIAQFHNGGHFYPTGKSIQKFSVFYEKASNNIISPLRDTYQNIPVSIFNKPLSILYDEGYLLIEDIEKDKSYGLETFCAENSYKSCYLFALDNINDKFLGVLGVYYNKNKHVLTEKELELVSQKAAAIGTILNTYLYETNKK